MLDDLNARLGPHRRDQRAGDLRAGRVATRVRHAVPPVPALAAERECPGGLGVEPRADRDQVPYRAGPLVDEDVYGVRVAQAGTGGQRVVPVGVRRVGGIQRGCDAALRPPCRAVIKPRLGDDQDAAAGPRQAQRDGEPGHPGPDDDGVGLGRPTGLRRGEALREQVHGSSREFSLVSQKLEASVTP